MSIRADRSKTSSQQAFKLVDWMLILALAFDAYHLECACLKEFHSNEAQVQTASAPEGMS